MVSRVVALVLLTVLNDLFPKLRIRYSEARIQSLPSFSQQRVLRTGIPIVWGLSLNSAVVLTRGCPVHSRKNWVNFQMRCCPESQEHSTGGRPREERSIRGSRIADVFASRHGIDVTWKQCSTEEVERRWKTSQRVTWRNGSSCKDHLCSSCI